MTTISIAMATFNGARFVERQLNSFLKQTQLPSELIVCDDESTDSTIDIIDAFSRSAPFPVVVVANPRRLGYTANFLRAARRCSGDLIAFSDQDDEWLPEKLTRIVEASRVTESLLIAHAAEWMDESGSPLGIVYPTDRRFRKHLQTSDFPGHAIVIRKSLLELFPHSLTPEIYKEVTGDIDFGHDVLLLEIATSMESVFFVPEVLMRWRVHSEIGHAWTKILRPAPRTKISVVNQIFPLNIAERYAASERSHRQHSVLLFNVLQDMALHDKGGKGASERVGDLMNTMVMRADTMKLRAALYGASSRKQRFKLLYHGVAMGFYRNSKSGGAGIHNALRDLLAILFQLPQPI